MQNRLLLASLLLIPVMSLAACDTGDDEEDLAEFRMSEEGEGNDLPWNDPDIQIHLGEETAAEECLIWDIKDGKVHNGPAENGDVLVVVDGDEIQDPNGNVLCTRERNELQDLTLVRDPSTGGDVLFTVYRRWVFEGELDLAGLSPWQKFKLLRSRLLYTFHGDQVFDGPAVRDDVLVTATENIQFASRTRKLLITALIEGECGGNGLPDY